MNYYNEHDPKAAAWLRELIKENHLPAGDVDERDIQQVKPHELKQYTQCHFFAGIGGWSYALQLAGWSADIPVWTGSCPCQPFSQAGQGKGTDDERHLWPEFARLIEACNPATVFGEQVASKAGREWLAGVFADLERMDYQRAGADLCAAGIGAPHIRQRIYWLANTKRDVWTHEQRAWSREAGRMGRINEHVPWDKPWERALSELRVVDDGLSPNGVVICCGARNAIVPQIAAEFISAYLEIL